MPGLGGGGYPVAAAAQLLGVLPRCRMDKARGKRGEGELALKERRCERRCWLFTSTISSKNMCWCSYVCLLLSPEFLRGRHFCCLKCTVHFYLGRDHGRAELVHSVGVVQLGGLSEPALRPPHVLLNLQARTEARTRGGVRRKEKSKRVNDGQERAHAVACRMHRSCAWASSVTLSPVRNAMPRK